MNLFYAIIPAFIAGVATFIGALLVVFNQRKSDKKIVFILGLSTGIMLILVLFELLPESYELVQNDLKEYALLSVLGFIVVGFVLMVVIDKLLHHKDDHELKHVGIVTTLAVSMHKFPEGMALFVAAYADIKIGLALAFATALHHIPEGMMIALPTYYASNSRGKALTYAAVSGMATPVGALLAMVMSNQMTNNMWLGSLFAVAIGMFLFVVLIELLPTALQYKMPKLYAMAILLGASTMYLVHAFTAGHH